MMKLVALSLVVLMLSAAQAATPQQIWMEGHIKDNAAYATDRHAILKINDAAYIHAGETVSLVGQPAKPESWHWVKGIQNGAALVTAFPGGRVQITLPPGVSRNDVRSCWVDSHRTPLRWSTGDEGDRLHRTAAVDMAEKILRRGRRSRMYRTMG